MNPISMETPAFLDLTKHIERACRDARRQVDEAMETATRNRLIELGWTPPNATPAPQPTPEADSAQLFGVKSDGTMVPLGTMRMPWKMKAKECIQGYFQGDPDDPDTEAAMALWVCEELVDWLKSQGLLQQTA